MSYGRALLLVLMIVAVFAVTGCNELAFINPKKSCANNLCYYVRPGVYLGGVGKIALFEPFDMSYSGELSGYVNDALARELRKNKAFSIRAVSRSENYWQDLDKIKAETYDLEKLATVRRELKANAVIFGCITEYEPFPRMAVGLRLRMLDLRTGKILWGVEDEWDSTDRAIQERMKCYYETSLRDGYEPIKDELLRVSPRAFYKFIASEVSQTIPESCKRW